ncbi:MAG: SDR family oxidoreductase [Chloroflexi bacterium]|nr:SDR family oxidoreductase [Chloroflexota bacterium]
MAGRVAAVTGAAGGIGSVICNRLAKAGATIVLVDIREVQETQALADALPGDNHLAVKTAIDDSSQVQELADLVETRFGTLDILVNNAGITRPVAHEDLDGLDDDLIDAIFRVNWRGGFACIRAFRKLLAGGDGGTVINISSIAATTAIGSNVAYCASKAAINSMTMSLARVLAPEIRVVAIAPGWVFGDYAKRVDPAYLQAQIGQTPMGRLATPEDVAEAIVGIVAHLPLTTGAIIPVDGGRPLGVLESV